MYFVGLSAYYSYYPYFFFFDLFAQCRSILSYDDNLKSHVCTGKYVTIRDQSLVIGSGATKRKEMGWGEYTYNKLATWGGGGGVV